MDLPVASEISLIVFDLPRFDHVEMRRFDDLELRVGDPFASEFAARRFQRANHLEEFVNLGFGQGRYPGAAIRQKFEQSLGRQ